MFFSVSAIAGIILGPLPRSPYQKVHFVLAFPISPIFYKFKNSGYVYCTSNTIHKKPDIPNHKPNSKAE